MHPSRVSSPLFYRHGLKASGLLFALTLCLVPAMSAHQAFAQEAAPSDVAATTPSVDASAAVEEQPKTAGAPAADAPAADAASTSEAPTTSAKGQKCNGKNCPYKNGAKGQKCNGKNCPYKNGAKGHGHHGHGHHGHGHLGHHGMGGTSTYHSLRMGCEEGKPCMTGGGFAVWPKARLIAGGEYIFDRPFPFVGTSPDVLFIGENDGFFVDHARLGFGGTWKRRLDFRMVLDGASLLPGPGVNDPTGRLFGSLRDAYVAWRPMKALNVWVGQMQMPQSVEGETSRADLHFSSRSVLSDGVRAGRGYATHGINPGRELGMMVGTEKVSLGGFDMNYRFALSNGNGRNERSNDNKLPAAYFRVGAGMGDLVQASVGGEYNPRTTGAVPNLYKETDSMAFADVKVDVMGIEMVGIAQARSTSFDTVFPQADLGRVDLAYGVTGWIALHRPAGFSLLGFTPAFRTSFYEPRTAIEGDTLWENTFALQYDPPTDMPMHVIFDATALVELPVGGVASVANNRVTTLFVFDL